MTAPARFGVGWKTSTCNDKVAEITGVSSTDFVGVLEYRGVLDFCETDKCRETIPLKKLRVTLRICRCFVFDARCRGFLRAS